MQIDLGSVKEARAVQINLAEQDYRVVDGAAAEGREEEVMAGGPWRSVAGNRVG